MPVYCITNMLSGMCHGYYEAPTAAEALSTMMQYELCEDVARDEFLVEEVNHYLLRPLTKKG